MVDDNKYYQLNNKDEAFYQISKLGYVNDKAKYWHHGEEPHKLFADELINFNEEYKCLKRIISKRKIFYKDIMQRCHISNTNVKKNIKNV